MSKVFVFDSRLGLEQVVESLGLAVNSVVFLDRVEAFELQTFSCSCTHAAAACSYGCMRLCVVVKVLNLVQLYLCAVPE